MAIQTEIPEIEITSKKIEKGLWNIIRNKSIYIKINDIQVKKIRMKRRRTKEDPPKQKYIIKINNEYEFSFIIEKDRYFSGFSYPVPVFTYSIIDDNGNGCMEETEEGVYLCIYNHIIMKIYNL